MPAACVYCRITSRIVEHERRPNFKSLCASPNYQIFLP